MSRFVPTDPYGVPIDPTNPGTGSGSGGTSGAAVALKTVLKLSSDDYGRTLKMSLDIQILDHTIYYLSQLTIFYLSPLDVSDDQVTVTTAASTYLNKAQIVAVVPFTASGKHTILSIPPVVYTPSGAEGGRRDYSLGGWMFVQVTDVPSGQVGAFYDYVSNLVRVPTFSADTSPVDSSENFYTISASTPPPDAYGIYTVSLTFQSPSPQVLRTRFAEVWMYNYRGLGLYENMGVTSVCKTPKSSKTVTYRLERDGGGHSVLFYVAECNALRMRRFAKPITSYGFGSILAGFP